MQIPSLPPPIVTGTLPQDLVAKAVPNLQAAPPLTQRPVDPAPKSEKSHHSRSNNERGKGGGRSNDGKDGGGKGGGDDRGGSVNIRV